MENYNGINASFGFTRDTAGVIAEGQVVPFNQVISNDSEICGCKRAIELNINTGEIFIKKSASYLITLDGTITPTTDAYLTLTGSNGKTIDIPLFTTGAGTRVMFLKKGIFKIQNNYKTAVPYVVGTVIPTTVIAVTIAEQRGL